MYKRIGIVALTLMILGLLIIPATALTVSTNKTKYYPGDELVVTGTATPNGCLLYTSPSPRDLSTSRMPSSA